MDAKTLVNALLKLDLTQAEIARRCSVEQSTISRIAAGLHADTKAKTLIALMELYRTVKPEAA